MNRNRTGGLTVGGDRPGVPVHHPLLHLADMTSSQTAHLAGIIHFLFSRLFYPFQDRRAGSRPGPVSSWALVRAPGRCGAGGLELPAQRPGHSCFTNPGAASWVVAPGPGSVVWRQQKCTGWRSRPLHCNDPGAYWPRRYLCCVEGVGPKVPVMGA